MPSDKSVRPSVLVLRKHGPLSIREITSKTAQLMGCSLRYEDVRAVLEVEARNGTVRLLRETPHDWREHVWEAIE